MRDNELVLDQAGLFQYSGVLDQLRDTAKYLARHSGHDPYAVGLMVDQLGVLRKELKAVFAEEASAKIDGIIPDINADDATYASVYFAAAALARWADTVHQTPQFLLSQEVAVANALKVTEKVEELLAQTQEPLSLTRGTGGPQLGQYL